MRNYFGLDSGDGAGNRKSQKEIKIPHDGIGNQLGAAEYAHQIPDNLGNSIDSAPTHQLNSAYRKKSEQAPHQRMGKYIIGGVNPVVAGLSHLIPQEQADQVTDSKPAENKQDKNDKRLKRLFDFDDEGQADYTLTSTPEEKRAQTELALRTIFEAAQSNAEVSVSLETINEKPAVSATVKSPLFKPEELHTAALGFLVNKIVNKMPSDRIRLSFQS